MINNTKNNLNINTNSNINTNTNMNTINQTTVIKPPRLPFMK